jgi:hypothetical protein
LTLTWIRKIIFSTRHLSDPMLRISSKQGVAWLLLSALALLLAPSLVAASRQLKGSDDYYQANVETDLPFGVDRFDRWGFQQTIGSYAQVRGWRRGRRGRREQAPESGTRGQRCQPRAHGRGVSATLRATVPNHRRCPGDAWSQPFACLTGASYRKPSPSPLGRRFPDRDRQRLRHPLRLSLRMVRRSERVICI